MILVKTIPAHIGFAYFVQAWFVIVQLSVFVMFLVFNALCKDSSCKAL